jgi:hypothetical protein
MEFVSDKKMKGEEMEHVPAPRPEMRVATSEEV